MIDEFSYKVANVFKVKIIRKIITVFNWILRGKIFYKLYLVTLGIYIYIYKEEKFKVHFAFCYMVKKGKLKIMHKILYIS